MKQWEYQQVDCHTDSDDREGVIEWLNKQGDEGWEAFTCHRYLTEAGSSVHQFLFKREFMPDDSMTAMVTLASWKAGR